MKIAMIGQKGVPASYGGIERHVHELSTKLAQNGHTVLAYARAWYTPRQNKQFEGIQIIHTPTLRTKNLDAIIHTFTATIHALTQKPDVFHYHGVGPALLSWIPRIFAPRAKVVVTFHCIDRYHQKWSWLARLMLRWGEYAACKFPHATITVSQSLDNYCRNEFGCNSVYIPNGAPVVDKTNLELSPEFNLESGKYLLMVARLVKHKGAHYLIDAWKKAQQEAPELLAGYQLAIAGGSTFTDDYVNALTQQAKDDDSIKLLGWVTGDKLQALYAHTTMLVHPSENEGMSLSILNAMAHGRAALVSDIAENREVIANTNFWCVPANVDALAERIVALIKDETLRATAGQQNQTLVEQKYNWPGITRHTERVYQR
jgi:glycosyltransferase involved in cell wall biosynthesis